MNDNFVIGCTLSVVIVLALSIFGMAAKIQTLKQEVREYKYQLERVQTKQRTTKYLICDERGGVLIPQGEGNSEVCIKAEVIK